MAMEKPFEGKEVWFGVGSCDLYGEEALRQVAEQSRRNRRRAQRNRQDPGQGGA